jgi:phosphoglycerate kinase
VVGSGWVRGYDVVEMSVLRVIDQVEVKGRQVLVRGDVDAPLKEGKVEDETRLELLVPTLRYLLDEGAKRVVLMGHLGRPGGSISSSSPLRQPSYAKAAEGKGFEGQASARVNSGLSLKIIREPLERLLGERVGFSEYQDIDLPSLELRRGEGVNLNKRVLILENLRFWEGEESNDKDFCEALAALGDVYVNEAFGVSHRNHASVVGVPQVMGQRGKELAVGLHLAKEVEMLTRVLKGAKKPVVVILGGAKAETKLPVIEGLWEIADVFLVGGVVANTFLAAEVEHPKKLGQSVVEAGQVKEARKLYSRCKKELVDYSGVEEKIRKILVPRDLVVAHWDGDQFYNVEEIESYHKKGEVFDQTKGIWELGNKSAQLFSSVVSRAGTVVWAGPLGYCEEERFCDSSKQVAEAVVGNKGAYKVVGGGDTEAMLTKFGMEGEFDWISSGGGAMMEFLAKRGTLPGLEVLSTSTSSSTRKR